MISNLLVVAGLCACCGFGALRSSPSIKNAISEEVGNNVLSTYEVYDEFIIEDSPAFNFGYANLSTPYGVTFFDNYFNYVDSTSEIALSLAYNGTTYRDFMPYFNDNSYSGNTNMDVIICSTYNSTLSKSYLYFTFAVKTSTALSLSSDGVNVNFDLLIRPNDFNIPITDSSFKFDILYANTSLISSTNGFSNNLGLGYTTSTDNDLVGNDENNSPAYFDWEYTFYDTEAETNVTGSRLGFSSSFPNVNTNGMESYSVPYYWNHFVYCLSWNNSAINDVTNPLGENIFCKVSMKGLETSSSSQYTLGFNAGYNAGYTDGALSSAGESYQTGYTAGYNDGVASNHTSWLGLFGAVADTPIMMLRSLFNYELFGINVLSVVMSLFTGMVVLYLLRKLL